MSDSASENQIEIKFYTDEHIPSAVAEQVARRDVDILRCQDAGLRDSSDEEHMALAYV